MFRFVMRKMISKKWMALSLLIGNILMIGVVISNPMYTRAVLQRTLERSFDSYIDNTNQYPFTVTLNENATAYYDEFLKREALCASVSDKFGLPEVEQSRYYQISASSTDSNLEREERKSKSVSLAMLSNMDDHISFLTGKGTTAEPDAEGIYDAVVTESGLLTLGLIPGEILTFPKVQDTEGQPLRFRVAGVITNSSESDLYWFTPPSHYSSSLFINEALFERCFLQENMSYAVTSRWHTMLDYNQISIEDVEGIINTHYAEIEEFGGIMKRNYSLNAISTLTEFQKTANRVRTTLLVLQIPILVLMAAFIFMVSRQMLDMEQSEIAVLKSRGAGRGQILSVYFIQSLIICAISVLIGVPLGILLVQILGSSNAFLEFVGRKALSPQINGEVFIYAGCAALLSVITMVLPAFRHSKVTIVNQKQRKHRKSDAPFWQKYFLDFILLGISLYGLFSFNNQKELLAERVIEGASLDPLLFISSSLFMLGAGLVAIRVLPVIVWLIFTPFKKRWSPALYTAFLRVLRTRNQQSFIMIFLVMTIALGMFDASAARTINEHNQNNLKYSIGADVVIQEQWENNRSVSDTTSDAVEYYEPDFGRYSTLEGVESITRVQVQKGVSVTVHGGTIKDAIVMGIHTKEFGETAWFDPALLPQHWYNYLNVLSTKARAVLVSSNFRDELGFKLGDSISYRNNAGKVIFGVIYGFVDYWPGYQPYSYTKDSDGLYKENENHLIVANLSQLQANWGVLPYQIWIRNKESSSYLYDFAEANNCHYAAFRDTSAEIVNQKNDPLIQGTNGVLTVGFIVVLLLCTVGFLIYWILSIKSRELQFGIFRAMGMSMREIITMLLGEHLFISVTSILTGGVIGVLTSKLFMPLIQIAYASYDSAIPLRVVMENDDTVRLAVIVGIMLVLCLTILGILIKRMKIAQALKLGED